MFPFAVTGEQPLPGAAGSNTFNNCRSQAQGRAPARALKLKRTKLTNIFFKKTGDQIAPASTFLEPLLQDHELLLVQPR